MSLRASSSPAEPYDLAVIGGGINGAGIARDAAGRGLSVVLFEKGDLGGGTSANSTKLIHGGLRYLEHYEFRLVREALIEREILLGIAPHIIWPLRFVLPHHPGLRPAWLLRLGLFLYDHLGGRKALPATQRIDLTSSPLGAPLCPGHRIGFEYSDCWVEDSRLVLLNAKDAAERGASILPRMAVTSARREGALWQITAEAEHAAPAHFRARALVNAAGPFVGAVQDGVIGSNQPARLRLVKGSHIVLPKLYDHDRAYIFQNADGRIIFAIPYERDFTLIGTTDEDHDDPNEAPRISDAEITYLCAAASGYFRTPIRREDIVWTYSGLRPLYDDGASKAQEATRDYVLKLEAPEGVAPLLSVFGGKITTYRKLAEAALAELSLRPEKAGWTARTPLPGGDFAPDGFAALLANFQQDFPQLPGSLCTRLLRAYGTRAWRIFPPGQDPGQPIGADLHEAELEYLRREEWATKAEDVLWRRSKLGLRFDAGVRERLARLMGG
jgi:glycerol-3-phosphate dehydrogenase